MTAQALITTEEQQFSIETIRLDEPKPTDIVVETIATGVSIGTEFALIRNKLSWGPYPLCTGYQGVGTVDWVGSDVDTFSKGATVYYRGNHGSNPRRDGTDQPVSLVSGTHVSRCVVDSTNAGHGAALLPEGADPAPASLFVMPAVGLFGVDMANPRMGESVVVYGVGQIGLGVVAACVHRGCDVLAVDLDQEKLELARAFGAESLVQSTTDDPDGADVESAVRSRFSDGADVVFECTGIPALVNPAIRLCRPYGSFVWQGNYGEGTVPLHFLTPHGKRLRMFFPCDDGQVPCRHAVLRNMALGALRWEKVITHRVAATEALALYEHINAGASDVIGAVILWN